MALRFHIENETNLPDGGPVSFTVTGKRIVDIGRDRHLDWTLPDPARLISGKHCEVHYRDGDYWLHDVSTNGTFLNGADQRMRGPHRLRSGDRFVVGHYIIGVALDSAEGIPDQIPNPETTGARNDERHRRRVMLGGDAAREQQQRERRNRRAETFDERRGGNNSQAASQQKVKHPSTILRNSPLC